MPTPIVHAPGDVTPFDEAFARIRSEFDIPAAFPAPVDAEAATVVQRGPVLPSGAANAERVDARDVPLVTIDPPGSLDLDQAFHAERQGNGFRVRYAIADVAAFVAPGGALDQETFARGVTLYLPDGRAPMLPNVVGEGGASLLPQQERPAVLWTIDLDETGAATAARLERATVRSRAQLDYPSVQSALDNGEADEPLQLLRRIGELRRALEAARGGVSLDLPSQDVIPAGKTFALEYSAPLPVEGWNAQISLLAGMEAAKIMLDARVGILRVVPTPQPWQIDRLRRSARGLDIPWPRRRKWSDVVRGLDRNDPDAAAFLTQAAHLLRGAGYAKLDASNTNAPASVPIHAGVAAPYAHVTAPLRRLADRYANEIVLAHCAGAAPPEWAVAAIDELVTTMQLATHREHAVDRAVVDAVECVVLAPHVGERFDAFVVDRNKQGVVVQLRRPAIVASLNAQIALGEPVAVTLVAVDAIARRVELAAVPDH